MKTLLFLSLLFLSAVPQVSFAWGERGHHTVCQVAAQLVSDRDLEAFLRARMHVLGHVCNVPDIHWKNVGPIAKPGDAAHFLDPENLGYTIDTVPTDLQKIIHDKQGKYSDVLKRNIDVAEDLGSNWWRFDQFYRLALTDAKSAKAVEKTAQGESKEKFTDAVYGMLTNMGLMGHFMGDAAQPYHNTSDYDGWMTGAGGIHSYYESAVINELSPSLDQEVYDGAVLIRAKQKPGAKSAIERVREVSITTFKDIDAIRKRDVVLEPSKMVKNPDGSTTKVKAKRKDAKETAKVFRQLAVREMAAAALALAQSWDQIYNEAGRPDLKQYNSYRYPLAPDFVPLDYFPSATVAK